MCLQTKPYAPALAVVACALGGRVGAMASVRDMYHCIDALGAMISQAVAELEQNLRGAGGGGGGDPTTGGGE